MTMLLEDAARHLPVGSARRALEVCAAGPAGAGMTALFPSVHTAGQVALADLGDGEFDFIAAVRAFAETDQAVIREAARLLGENGVICARLNKVSSPAELTELARDQAFQILTLDGVSSRWTSIVWRKRAADWRSALAEHASLAASRIVRITNAKDDTPVVPSRGRYATMAITVESLPMDADLADVEVVTGGMRASALSISVPDARGLQRIVAVLPGLEQTGLIPVELRWFGERLTVEPEYIRVISPGPAVPRIHSITTGASRLAGITISIEELARPEDLTATMDGVAIWSLETQCVDARAQDYNVRLFIPEEIEAGAHQIQLTAGRRKLAPFTVEIN